MEKKKICCITTIGFSTNIFVADAMRQFVERGYEVTIVCADTENVRKEKGDIFRYVDIPMRRGMSLKDLLVAPFRFLALFRREKFDLIQYTTPNASLYASLGAWMAGAPVRLYCQWGLRYVGASGVLRKVLKALEYLTCALSTDISCASHKNLEYAVSEGLFKPGKASVLGDGGTIGVDLQKYDLARKPEYKAEALGCYPVLRDKLVICSVGRLSRDKGSFELLEASARHAARARSVYGLHQRGTQVYGGERRVCPSLLPRGLFHGDTGSNGDGAARGDDRHTRSLRGDRERRERHFGAAARCGLAL